MPDVRNGATGSTGSTCSPCGSVNTFKEAACIDVNRIYDTCREQDCLEDLRVYFCEADNCLVERAVDIRCKSAEIVWVYLDTEPMSFNKGCYMVKIKFFFKCTFELCIGLKSATETFVSSGWKEAAGEREPLSLHLADHAVSLKPIDKNVHRGLLFLCGIAVSTAMCVV